MDAIIISLMAVLFSAIIFLVIASLISVNKKKRQGNYDELTPKSSKHKFSRQKNVKTLTEKKFRVRHIFSSLGEYQKKRAEYFAKRKKLAHYASRISNYKERQRAFKMLAKDSFFYA